MSNIDQAVKSQISDLAFEISQDQGQVDDLKKSTKLFTDNINRNSLKLAAVMIAATANMKGQKALKRRCNRSEDVFLKPIPILIIPAIMTIWSKN